ncbi:MAG: carboxypeptidase-like regulatory domain-containing protein [Oscillospiraceae bacterium]
MDDMKKLVEKYKRELMEYSRTAKPEKLSFPEMLPDEQPEAPAVVATAPAEQQPLPEPPSFTYMPEDADEKPRMPRIVGYSDDQSALDSLEKYLSGLETTPTDTADDMNYTPDMDAQPATEAPAPEQSFNELPPQFTDTAPQNDFTGNAVIPETNFSTDITEPEQPNPFPRTGEVNTAAPGQEENIGNIPESGQNPEEQLGRRSFESQQTPRNSPEDIKPLVQQQNDGFPKFPPEPKYDTYEDFIRANSRLGSLSFRTYTARNALPVPNANIVVFKEIGGQRHTFYTLTTDRSGQTEEVTIPAPPSSLSQSPTSAVQPYSLYDAEITAEGFDPVSVKNLPIFEGILSVQRTAMIPTAGLSVGETITEEEPELTEVPNA